jgi:SAM-dependent methyltransferase
MAELIAPATRSVISGPDTQAAIWFLGALSQVRLSGEQTGGAFSLAENLSRRGNGSPVHVHDQEDETLVVLDGELRVFTGEEEHTADPAPSRSCPGVSGTPTSSPPLPRGSSRCTPPADSSGSRPKPANPPGLSRCPRNPRDRTTSPRWLSWPPGTALPSWPRRPVSDAVPRAEPIRQGATVSYLDVFDHVAIDEDERLRALGEALNDGTFHRLGRLVPGPAARCLDIGAGNGTISRRLAQLCPDGEVIATDLDISDIRTGPGTAANLTVMRHDVTTDDFADGSFDLIVARWVFMHLPQPAITLARVARWLAPGGRLLIEDGADFAMHCSPDPLYRKVTSAIELTLAELAGTDLKWARTFPAPLAGLGLERLGLAADLPVAAAGTAMSRFLVTSAARLSKPLTASGRLTDDEITRWHQRFTGEGCWELGLANIAAWGHRPARPA